MNYCNLAKIIVANAFLLHNEADRFSVKIHIDRTRDDGKWAMSAIQRTPIVPDFEYDEDFDLDEWDQDFGGFITKESKLEGALFEDVFEAMAAKEMIITMINSFRLSYSPFESAHAAANEDQQGGYGKGGGIGFYRYTEDGRYPF